MTAPVFNKALKLWQNRDTRVVKVVHTGGTVLVRVNDQVDMRENPNRVIIQQYVNKSTPMKQLVIDMEHLVSMTFAGITLTVE